MQKAKIQAEQIASHFNSEFSSELFLWGIGTALSDLGQYQQAIDSYDNALEFKPDDHSAWYNKACCYGLQGDIEQAIQNLQHSIALHPECREWAKTDEDFDRIRNDDRFQALIEE